MTRTVTTSSSDAASEDLSTGAKAGIGIGAAFGAFAVSFFAFFLYRRKQQKKNSDGAGGSSVLESNAQEHHNKSELAYTPVSQHSQPVDFQNSPQTYSHELFHNEKSASGGGTMNLPAEAPANEAQVYEMPAGDHREYR
jgi:hypothetical protein